MYWRTYHKSQQINVFLAVFQPLNNLKQPTRVSCSTGFSSTRWSSKGSLFILAIFSRTVIASSSLPFDKSHRGDSDKSLIKWEFYISMQCTQSIAGNVISLYNTAFILYSENDQILKFSRGQRGARHSPSKSVLTFEHIFTAIYKKKANSSMQNMHKTYFN